MTGFFERVYELVRQVPRGRVVSYGQIAAKLGTRDARRVGWALHSNPDGDKTPCHRVVNKEGRVAANFGFGNGEEQRLRLEREGVRFNEKGLVEMKKYGYEFK